MKDYIIKLTQRDDGSIDRAYKAKNGSGKYGVTHNVPELIEEIAQDNERHLRRSKSSKMEIILR